MFAERNTDFSLKNNDCVGVGVGGSLDSYDKSWMLNNCPVNKSDSFYGGTYTNNNIIHMRKKHVRSSSSLPSSGDEESISPNSSYCVGLGSGRSADSDFSFNLNVKNSERLSSSSMASPSCGSNSGNNNNHQNMRCFECGQIILSRFYLFAMNRHFHSQCLKCHQCNLILSDEPTCFEKDGRILCKQDYYRMYNSTSPRHPRRCARCTTPINSNDLVMRACDLVYHVDCFVCTICQRALNRGDQFRMQSTDLYCNVHYDMIENFNSSDEFPGDRDRTEPTLTPSKSSSNHPSNKRGRPPKRKLLSGVQENLKDSDRSLDYFHPAKPPSLGLSNIGSMNAEFNQIMDSPINGFSMGLAHDIPGVTAMGMGLNGDGTPGQQQKGKRMRTTFKHNQLRVMKSYFDMNPNPDTKDLKQLSQKTGLCKRVLQVWFQNSRAKHRRSCPRSESSLSGGGVLQIEDSQEWSPPQNFGQNPATELNNNTITAI